MNRIIFHFMKIIIKQHKVERKEPNLKSPSRPGHGMHQYNDRCLIVLISVCFAGSFVASFFVHQFSASFALCCCFAFSPSSRVVRLRTNKPNICDASYNHPEPCVYTNLFSFAFWLFSVAENKTRREGKERWENCDDDFGCRVVWMVDENLLFVAILSKS